VLLPFDGEIKMYIYIMRKEGLHSRRSQPSYQLNFCTVKIS